MEIQNLRPIVGAGNAVAHFDIEVAPGVRLINWQLRKSAGGWHSFPPRSGNGTPAAKVEPHMLDLISAAAAAALTNGGQRANDQIRK